MGRAFRSLVLGLVAAATLAFGASAQAPRDPENTLFLDLEYGRVTIVLRPDLAPSHVARVKELVRDRHVRRLGAADPALAARERRA